MKFSDQIANIQRRPSAQPISATELLCELLENEIQASKSYFNWFTDFSHIPVTYLIIRELKKDISESESIQNIINDILSAIPLNDRLSSLFKDFFKSYPRFIVLLPETLIQLNPFFKEAELILPSMKACKFIEKYCPRTHEKSIDVINESLIGYIHRLVLTDISQKRDVTALLAFNYIAPGLSSVESAYCIDHLLDTKLFDSNQSSFNDMLITAINLLANRIKSLLKPAMIEKIILLTFKFKSSDVTSCIKKIITFYPVSQRHLLLAKARADVNASDKSIQYFGFQMLGVLNFSAIKLSDVSDEQDLNKVCGFIDIFSTRLETCTNLDIENILRLAFNCLASDDSVIVIRAFGVINYLTNYTSEAQLIKLINVMADISIANDEILVGALNTSLGIIKKIQDITQIPRLFKLMTTGVYHTSNIAYEPAHQLCYEALKADLIDVDKLIAQCMSQILKDNASAAELLVLIKELLSPAQQRLVGEKSLEIYNNIDKDESRSSAARIIGQYFNCIQHVDARRITDRLCNFVFNTYSTTASYKSLCENKAAIILLENMTPLIDEKNRIRLLEFLYRNITHPYVKRLLVPLIEDTLDKQNSHLFTKYASLADARDHFHLYNDDVDVDIKSLTLQRLIHDIHYKKRTMSIVQVVAPALVSHRPN